MKNVVLIACAKTKLQHRAPAQDIYTSSLFKLGLAYARALRPDVIYVLSAKHGLLPLTQEIAPYELTLKNMSTDEARAWANRTLKQLRRVTNLSRDHFVFLAGKKYREFLVPHMRSYAVPLEDLKLGKQLQRLKELLDNVPSRTTQMKARRMTASRNSAEERDVCALLHRLAWRLARHTFPFEKGSIPRNGVYLLFERGETGHGGDRIVRVGSHTGEGQLRSRLAQHFLVENKDRSIFRKNIGRALLSKDADPFLEYWELDLTARQARAEHQASVDWTRQTAIEAAVSEYVRQRFSFVAFEVAPKADRLAFESKLIATVAACNECRPSAGWLGLHSPKAKIRQNGMWLVNHLFGIPAGLSDLLALENANSTQVCDDSV